MYLMHVTKRAGDPMSTSRASNLEESTKGSSPTTEPTTKPNSSPPGENRRFGNGNTIDPKKFRSALFSRLDPTEEHSRRISKQQLFSVGNYSVGRRGAGVLAILICSTLITSAYANVAPVVWDDDFSTVMTEMFSLSSANETRSVAANKDHIPPKISIVNNVVAEATGGLTVVELDEPAVTDDVDRHPIVTNNAPAGGYPLGTHELTWTAKDSAGNTVTASQKVIVVDTVPPMITAPPDIVAETNADSLLLDVLLGTPSVSDGLDSASLVTNDAPLTGFQVGVTTVIWKATDASGNSATDIQLVSVVKSPASNSVTDIANKNSDKAHPSSNSTNLAPSSSATSETSSPPSSSITYGGSGGGGGGATGPGTDNSSDSESGTDSLPPKITPPPMIIAEATGPITSVDLGLPMVSDISDPNPVVSNNVPSGGFALGTTIVIWTATDAAENSANAEQRIVVEDNTSPSIVAPADIVAEATSLSTKVSLGIPTVGDMVDASLTVTNNAPAQGFKVGDSIIEWKATDASGNSAIAVQLVRIIDTTPPTILAPADDTINIETASEAVVIALGKPLVDDKGDNAPTVKNNAPDDGFLLGKTTVTWTATDASGNTATDTQIITVKLETNGGPGPDPNSNWTDVWSDLRGVNFIDPVLRQKESSGEMGVQNSHVHTYIPKLKNMGLNLIRLPVYWEAYPGNEENFLDEIELIVQTAEENEIYVWIDFHHFDATSYWRYACAECGDYNSYGRGFPKSVVGQYHPTTDYEHDPEVVAFWNDYYLNQVRGVDDVWSEQADFMKSIIAKVDQYDNVIGYEILNEPHFFKSEHYAQMGILQTEIGSKLREVTDKAIIFTRETGHHGFKRITASEDLLLPKISGKIVYAPHVYSSDSVDTNIKNWKAYQKEWADIGYNIPIGVGEWAVQAPQTTTLTQAAMDGFVSQFREAGFFWTYWAYAGFDMDEGNVLINEDGTLTSAGEYLVVSVQKSYS
jgi:aryl-phospho-beta-D-glucosidase BglC (GH1 family)